MTSGMRFRVSIAGRRVGARMPGAMRDAGVMQRCLLSMSEVRTVRASKAFVGQALVCHRTKLSAMASQTRLQGNEAIAGMRSVY